MSDSIEGIYKGKPIAGTLRWGSAGTGNDQGAVDVTLPTLALTGTVILPLTEKSAPFTYDRLKALDWDGKTYDVDGFPSIPTLGEREVFIAVRTELYEGKMQLRFELHSGRVEIATFKPEERKMAGANIRRMLERGATAPRSRARRADGPPEEEFYDDR